LHVRLTDRSFYVFSWVLGNEQSEKTIEIEFMTFFEVFEWIAIAVVGAITFTICGLAIVVIRKKDDDF
jgi:hypothetical protein